MSDTTRSGGGDAACADSGGPGTSTIVFTSPFGARSGSPVVAAVGGYMGPFASDSRRTSLASLTGSTASSTESAGSRGSRRTSLPSAPTAWPTPMSTIAYPVLTSLDADADTSFPDLARACATSVDFSRRRSVDVGVLGMGSHRQFGMGLRSKSTRDAVGPDAGDKEFGLVGSGLGGGKDRLLGRHLASILAHSLALCADPPPVPSPPPIVAAVLSRPPLLRSPLPIIVASPLTSPGSSRQTSISDAPLDSPLSDAPPYSPLDPLPISAPVFPVVSESKRFKLISNLQLWTFNPMDYTPDELLSCVGLIFESVRSMEGVEFDQDRFKALLLSLRSAYHDRCSYHNFAHAADVTQACYTFLVRMGLAPPLHLLCEEDYDPILGEGRRKWRRNRAVAKGGMGELLRPMDVFALMVSAIGHDIGHPGLSNAYMVNARTPVAQVYDDKSVLENFHTVTLIHLLRRHGFAHLLGGEFGHLGEHATDFRKVLEASILATDMSRHFGFVSQLNDMGRRFGERRPSAPSTFEEDRLLLCAGLIKSADISNATRPHRISKAWSTALLNEWTAQASIESEFGLPITVPSLNPADSKAQSKTQVGFIDLFAAPLFGAMAGVVDEFADFAEKLRDGRAAWEAISLERDEAFLQQQDWKLSAVPSGRSRSESSTPMEQPRSLPIDTPVPSPPLSTGGSLGSPRSRPPGSFRGNSYQRHLRQASDGSTTSSTNSPLSSYFPGSASFSSITTGTSSLSIGPLWSTTSRFVDPFPRFSCGGVCSTATATCETCSLKQDPDARRGSMVRGFTVALKGDDLDSMRYEGDNDEEEMMEQSFHAWPPFPFQPT